MEVPYENQLHISFPADRCYPTSFSLQRQGPGIGGYYGEHRGQGRKPGIPSQEDTIQMYRNFTEIRRWRFLMKISITYLFLLIGAIQLLSASNGKGQGLEDIMVNIEVSEGNLEFLLKRIEFQTRLTFAYLPTDVRK